MELAARQQFHACTGDLEKVVLFELLKHASFDLDELVGNEECQQMPCSTPAYDERTLCGHSLEEVGL